MKLIDVITSRKTKMKLSSQSEIEPICQSQYVEFIFRKIMEK